MRLFESRVTGNVYNKIDAENWRVVPKFSRENYTSYIDVNNLVFIDDKILASKGSQSEVDVSKLFDEINASLELHTE